MDKSVDEWVPTVLGHAILQLLSRNQHSGYDLKKRFHGTVGHGWHAYDTQIYRELRRLEDGDYVRGHIAKGRSGPQRRLYTITEKGLDSLRTWLASPIDVSKNKDEVGLRAWTADLFPKGAFEDFLDQVREQWNETLAHERMSLRALAEEFGDPVTTTVDSVVGRQLAIELVIATTEARLAWADQAEKIVRRRTAHENRSS